MKETSILFSPWLLQSSGPQLQNLDLSDNLLQVNGCAFTVLGLGFPADCTVGRVRWEFP